jgi:hypothetical protein
LRAFARRRQPTVHEQLVQTCLHSDEYFTRFV